jgi:2'-5' RNA ligase
MLSWYGICAFVDGHIPGTSLSFEAITMRSFIAVDLDEQTRSKLAAIQGQLKETRAAVRWVNPASIHLTLKFLGNINPTQVEPIVTAASQVVEHEPYLHLCADGLGAFPGLQNPRVVWVGIRGDVERCARIQTGLETALEALGFPREQRAFHPHLTLGRLKNNRNRRSLIDTLGSLKLPEFIPFDVTEIILYKSDLRPTGAIYTKLHCMPLTAPPPSESEPKVSGSVTRPGIER